MHCVLFLTNFLFFTFFLRFTDVHRTFPSAVLILVDLFYLAKLGNGARRRRSNNRKVISWKYIANFLVQPNWTVNDHYNNKNDIIEKKAWLFS